MEITHYSNSDQDYVKAVKSCKTLDELKQIVTEYRMIAEDAYQAVMKMDDQSFEQFCKGRNKTKLSVQWMEMYGAVLLPGMVLRLGIISVQCGVPFGAVYHRYKDQVKRVMEDTKPCLKKQRKRS